MNTLTFNNVTLLKSAIIGFETFETTYSTLFGRKVMTYHIRVHTIGSYAHTATIDKGQHEAWIDSIKRTLR